MTMSSQKIAEENHIKELKLWKIALRCVMAYAALALGVALLTNSQTLMLDGLYSSVDIAVNVLALYVVKKIKEPENEQFHFGFAKLEPFMFAVEGILLLGLCVSTAFSALQNLVHPEEVGHLGVIVIFAFASIFLNFGLGAYLLNRGRAWKSDLLVADAKIWLIEGWVSLGVCVSFTINYFMSRSPEYASYSVYLDPLTCLIIAACFSREPIQILKESFYDLIDACPDDKHHRHVLEAASQIGHKHGLKGVEWYRFRKAGRKYYLIVCFTSPGDRSLGELEKMRRQIVKDLHEAEPELDVTVAFGSVENEIRRAKRFLLDEFATNTVIWKGVELPKDA